MVLNVFVILQVMEYTGRCVALSEPSTMNAVVSRYALEGDTPEVRQFTRDVIRWECRPYPSMEPPPFAHVIKFKSLAAIALPLFV